MIFIHITSYLISLNSTTAGLQLDKEETLRKVQIFLLFRSLLMILMETVIQVAFDHIYHALEREILP
jgi:hypothetical protein